jgi:hypothetical protein
LGKTETISPKVRNETRMPTLTTSIKHSPEFLARSIRQKEEMKLIKIGKEIIKVSLFADDMILYIKYPKNFTQRFYKQFQQCSKIQNQLTEVSSLSIHQP